MGRFIDDCCGHAELETFDAAAFKASPEMPANVCAFVLALAAVYNDSKDVIYALQILQSSMPEPPPRKSRQWGIYFALNAHLFRIHVGILHELFELIKDNKKVIQSAPFRSLVKQMHRETRQSWRTLVDVALGSTPANPFGYSLLMARNKIAFHYDAKRILRGYEEHFLGPQRRDERAYISRGDSLNNSRFYFADAALQACAQSVAVDRDWHKLVNELQEVFRTVNFALMGVVETFIQRRAGSYRPEGDAVDQPELAAD